MNDRDRDYYRGTASSSNLKLLRRRSSSRLDDPMIYSNVYSDDMTSDYGHMSAAECGAAASRHGTVTGQGLALLVVHKLEYAT